MIVAILITAYAISVYNLFNFNYLAFWTVFLTHYFYYMKDKDHIFVHATNGKWTTNDEHILALLEN